MSKINTQGVPMYNTENIANILHKIKLRSITDESVNVNRECEVGHLHDDEIETLTSLGYKVSEIPSTWIDTITFHWVSWDADTIPEHETIQLNVNNYTIHYKLNPMKDSTEEDNHAVVTFRHTNDVTVCERAMRSPDENASINSDSVFGIEKLMNFSEADIKAMLINRIKDFDISDLHRLIELSPGLLMGCYYSILNPDETISLVDCRLDIPTSNYIYAKK
jgi:hypothetical protein